MLRTGTILPKRQRTTEYSLATKVMFNAQQLVVFCSTFSTTRCTSFDLTGTKCHCQIGNGGIFSFTRTVREDTTIATFASHVDGIDRLSQSSNLVWLNQYRIGDTKFDTTLKSGYIGDK